MEKTRIMHMGLRGALASTMVAGLLVGSPSPGSSQTAQTADLSLQLDIPEEIGIDVDGEFVFDLSRATGNAGGNPCVDRFPPGPDCPFAFYFPTSTSFRRAAAANGPAPGTIVLSFIDNLPTGTLHLRHSISAEWIGGDPGIPTTAIQSASGVGERAQAHFEPIPTTPREFLAVTTPRGLTRADRILRLALAKDARVIFTPSPVTARITYEILHSPS